MIYSTLTHLRDCHMETNTAPSEVFLTRKTSKSNYSHRSEIIQFDIQTSVRATSVHVMLWHRENTELGTSFSHLWKRSLSLTCCKTTKGLEGGSSEHPMEDVPSINMKGTERQETGWTVHEDTEQKHNTEHWSQINVTKPSVRSYGRGRGLQFTKPHRKSIIPSHALTTKTTRCTWPAELANITSVPHRGQGMLAVRSLLCLLASFLETASLVCRSFTPRRAQQRLWQGCLALKFCLLHLSDLLGKLVNASVSLLWVS